MKTTITIIYFLLFTIPFLSAQNNEVNSSDFFFTTELDSLGISYGKCLIQPQWDTMPERTIIQDGPSKLVLFDSVLIDTVYTDYFVLKDRRNMPTIFEYVDTSRLMVLVQEESRRLLSPSSFGNDYENVFVTELYKEEHMHWINEENKINSTEWKLKFNPPVYEKREKTILNILPGTTREEVIPAEYETMIAIRPKEDIEPWQLKNIHSLCNQFYLKKEKMHYSFEKKMLELKYIHPEIILVETASTSLRAIHSSEDLNLISQIQKQLFALGFYNESFSGELSKHTKEAIIDYQLKHNLPIGQLDKETVSHIIARKTPFNQ